MSSTSEIKVAKEIIFDTKNLIFSIILDFSIRYKRLDSNNELNNED